MSLEHFGGVMPVVWLRTIRAPFLTVSLVPVIAGAALAWYIEGLFDPFLFTITLVGVAFFHAGSNLLNDYCDHQLGCDDPIEIPSPYNGGRRSLREGFVAAGVVLALAIILLMLGSLAGLVLFVHTPGPAVLWLFAIGAFLGYSYAGTPIRLAHRGLGEITAGCALGLLPVLGSYLVQTGHVNDSVLWAGGPISFLVMLILFVNQFPDYFADKAAGRRNLVVRWGRRKSTNAVPVLIGLPFLMVIAAVVQEKLPIASLWTCACAPLAMEVWRSVHRRSERPGQFVPAMADSAKLHLVFGLILSASFVIARLGS